jgi:hypothetical protein
MNGKVAFKNTLQRKNEGPLLFIPFLFGLAAKIANIPLREMVWDPTYYAYSLEGAYKLFHYGVIINNFDGSIEAESCGCELEWQGEFENPVITKSCDFFKLDPEDFLKKGRIPVLFEVSKRLVASLGRETAITGVLTGPCSLIRCLHGESGNSRKDFIQEATSLLGSFLQRLVRNFCEIKTDGIFIREDLLGRDFWEELGLFKDPYRAVYATLFNLIRAYNNYPILVVKDFPMEAIKELHTLLKPSAIVLCNKKLDEGELLSLKNLSDSLKVCFGLPLPVGRGRQDELWEQLAVIKSFVAKQGPKGFFYTSDGEIPYNVPLEIVHELMGQL